MCLRSNLFKQRGHSSPLCFVKSNDFGGLTFNKACVVFFFVKTWCRETVKKTVAKGYQFMENFRLLFGPLTTSYVAERIARINIKHN